MFCCSRLNPAKGYQELLHTVLSLVEKDWDVRLRIAGQDEVGGQGYLKELKKLTNELNLERQVMFIGSVSREQVRDEHEKCHLLFFPLDRKL